MARAKAVKAAKAAVEVVDRTKRVTLPPSLMKTMQVIAESKAMVPIEQFEAMVLVTHGYGLYARQQSVDPSLTAIPKKQWGEIAEYLMNLHGSDLARVNLSLDWVNIGPSSWEGGDDAADSDSVAGTADEQDRRPT